MVEVKQVQIVVDSREANSGIPAILKRTPGVDVLTRELECGDYIIGKGIVVERKSGADFVSSILSGRTIPQITLMDEAFDKVIILIEGDIYNTRSQMERAAIIGAEAWMSVLKHASMIRSPDSQFSAEFLHRAAIDAQHGLGYEPPLRSNKPKLGTAMRQYIVEGLPGVGPKTAQALLSHMGSVLNVFSATQEELAGVPGVGKKTAERVFEAIRGSHH